MISEEDVCAVFIDMHGSVEKALRHADLGLLHAVHIVFLLLGKCDDTLAEQGCDPVADLFLNSREA